MSRARKVYDMLRQQLHERGLLRPKYLRLGEADVTRLRRELEEAMREESAATAEPPQITEKELDYYFGEKKR